MKNREFISQCYEHIGDTAAKSREHGSLYFRNGILYSYGDHYPLLFEVGNTVFCNNRGWSSTTACHIGLANCYANHNVDLGFCADYTPKICKRTIRLCLNTEARKIKTHLKSLSVRAWRQRERKEERLTEIEHALNAI